MVFPKLQIVLFSGALLSLLVASISVQLTQKLLDAYYYSKASYCEANRITTRNCGVSCTYHQNLESIQVFSNQEVKSQGYCAYDTNINSIIVAFRGTDQIQNWLSNLNFIPIPYYDSECKNCKVHQGFMNILQSISYELTSCVINLKVKYNTTSIIVTGHSLGGAMATLFSVQLKSALKNKFQSFQLITFGSPRVGNLEFVNYANSLFGNDSYRLVNKQDIVPHLPYNTIGFQHIGFEYWFNNKEDPFSYSVCNSTTQGESPMCASSGFINFSVKDHLHYFGIYSGCVTESLQDKEAEKLIENQYM